MTAAPDPDDADMLMRAVNPRRMRKVKPLPPSRATYWMSRTDFPDSAWVLRVLASVLDRRALRMCHTSQ